MDKEVERFPQCYFLHPVIPNAPTRVSKVSTCGTRSISVDDHICTERLRRSLCNRIYSAGVIGDCDFSSLRASSDDIMSITAPESSRRDTEFGYPQIYLSPP